MSYSSAAGVIIFRYRAILSVYANSSCVLMLSLDFIGNPVQHINIITIVMAIYLVIFIIDSYYL